MNSDLLSDTMIKVEIEIDPLPMEQELEHPLTVKSEPEPDTPIDRPQLDPPTEMIPKSVIIKPTTPSPLLPNAKTIIYPNTKPTSKFQCMMNGATIMVQPKTLTPPRLPRRSKTPTQLVYCDQVKSENEVQHPPENNATPPPFTLPPFEVEPLFLMPTEKRTAKDSTVTAIVLSVFKHCIKNWRELGCYSKADCVAQTSDIAGVKLQSVYTILREYRRNINPTPKVKKKPGRRTFIDQIEKKTFAAIKSKCQEVFNSCGDRGSTIDQLYRAVREDPDLPKFSVSTMRRVIRYLELDYMIQVPTKMLKKKQ